MDSFSLYFERYATKEQVFKDIPNRTCPLIVCIPAYKEERLHESLLALATCYDPGCPVHVLVLVNGRNTDPPEIKRLNEKTYNDLIKCPIPLPDWMSMEAAMALDIPEKIAGVGTARKILMDYAAKLHQWQGLPKGLMLCFDADCSCSPNYLHACRKAMEGKPLAPGAHFYFEHALEMLKVDKKSALIHYELWLRYYVEGLRKANYPFAFPTVGSCILVRANAYISQGGMNQRQAAEDFHFLHKIFPLGHFFEVQEACIYPSARCSDRVPFGTGKAMLAFEKGDLRYTRYYHPDLFDRLGIWLSSLESFFDSSLWQPDIREPWELSYFESIKAEEKLLKIKKNAKKQGNYVKALYRWMDGIKILRFIHEGQEKAYPDVAPTEAYTALGYQGFKDLESLLSQVRKKQRETHWEYFN